MKTRPAAPIACAHLHPLPFLRQSGEPARERVLLAGLRLFADQGYAKTSIRQIALAAGANIAAVSYYFGNKAGLYRAVFWGTPASSDRGTAAADPADRPVQTLDDMYRRILEPLRSGALARYWIRLHRREMLEPTGLWQEKVDRGMQPMHAALVALLCDRLGLERPDDEVRALAVLVIAPAVHLLVNCEVIDAVSPQLLAGADAVDAWRERCLLAADAMIAGERERRKRLAAIASPRPEQKTRKTPPGSRA
ncbi:MAG TPA: CerR family C-terminal domain-containing protein [Caldimonas sp.]|nr:CerR family C-terminal domain-containing protein [Caldimonas sp.]